MITIIAAIANNKALGLNNKLIWHLPEDLKRFKSVTKGHHIIMGRKTFESLLKPLPNRTTIIITQNKNYIAPPECIVVNSLDDALEKAQEDENPYILGGSEIYKMAMSIADKLDLTLVHHEFEADAFFPEIDSSIWKETSRKDFNADDVNKYDYSFVTYEKY